MNLIQKGVSFICKEDHWKSLSCESHHCLSFLNPSVKTQKRLQVPSVSAAASAARTRRASQEKVGNQDQENQVHLASNDQTHSANQGQDNQVRLSSTAQTHSASQEQEAIQGLVATKN